MYIYLENKSTLTLIKYILIKPSYKMSKAKSQFIGATGQYFVAYELSIRNIIANITLGNAPGIDILASDASGLASISIQVKTSSNAWRKNRYGNKGCEWDVNQTAIDRHSANFWYAFVDLQKNNNEYNPRTFIVPSLWVAEFVRPDFSRKIYFLPESAFEQTLNKWEHITQTLENDKTTIDFATNWQEEILIRWGN